ncbi:MAG TPA: prepilin peptidase [Terrimesophilobacter sp.]|nr:prepilin peptidase [Terrimesophilobacter sp.]
MTEPTSGVVLIVAILVGVLGLAIGSFLNVVVWRVPNGMSLSSPPSACPKCQHPIRARDNIPIVSWLILRGTCRDCGEPISVRYPLVELGTALAFVGVALWSATRPAGLWLLPAYLYFAAVSIALALIDLDTRKLPNRLVVPSIAIVGILLALVSFATGDWFALLWAIVAGAALFLFYFLLVVIYPSGMGFGDVKLAAVVGLALGYLGWGSLLVGAFAAFLLGGIFSVVLLATRRATRKTGIPFGPWMLLGAWVGIVFGREIALGYLTLVGIS